MSPLDWEKFKRVLLDHLFLPKMREVEVLEFINMLDFEVIILSVKHTL